MRRDSRSPVKRDQSIEHEERRSSSPRPRRSSPPPSKGRKYSPSPDERSPQERGTPSPKGDRAANGSEYSRSPTDDAGIDERRNLSPIEENGRSHSNSPIHRENGSPMGDDENHGSPRGSESP